MIERDKHLLDEAETNIQNYHACEINSGRRRRQSPLFDLKSMIILMLVKAESK